MATPRKHAQKKRYELTRQKFLSDEELKDLHHVFNLARRRNKRNVAMFELILATGARAREILGLRYDDLFHVEQKVFIRGLKDSNDRAIPIPPHLFKTLTELPVEDGLIFPICYERMREIWNDIRPFKKTIHALRHTFAIGLYRQTKDIKLVQRALGHRSFSNTLIYLDFQASNDEMMRILDYTDQPKGA